MKLRRKVAVTATAVLAACGVTLMATPAQADLVTLCSGHGGAITLPTDLAVPKDKDCYLDGTVIQGDVTVRQGANLHILDGEIEGEVIVQRDGYFDASSTSVGDRVVNRSSYGTHLDESSTGGALRAVQADGGGDDGFLFVVDSSVRKVNAKVGDLYVSDSRIGGTVNAEGVEYADLYDSVVRGDLTVTSAVSGGILCDSEVLGAATYSGGSGPIAVGDGPSDGFCGSVNYIDGDLSATGVAGGVYVDNNIVGGDLITSDNEPTAQVGDANRVRGDVITEAVALRALRAQVTEEFEAHEEDLEETVEDARAETVEEAMEAGPAF